MYCGVPQRLLYSSPCVRRWASPKSIILMWGWGTVLSASIMFSGCIQTTKPAAENTSNTAFFFQTPTQTGILFIFSTSSSPLYLSYLCALVCVCVCLWACHSHLKVKVGDVFAVHEANSLEDLLKELNGLLLWQVLLLSYEIKQLSTTDTGGREREGGNKRENREKERAREGRKRGVKEWGRKRGGVEREGRDRQGRKSVV